MDAPNDQTARVPAEVVLKHDDRVTDRRVLLRVCTTEDRQALMAAWSPLLALCPPSWLDRLWMWDKLDHPDELAFPGNSEFLVLADEVEKGSRGDLLGVLVTTGPVSLDQVGLSTRPQDVADVLWVEYIASAPALRPLCPMVHRRKPQLKLVGQRLMMAAIERSREMGCEGRIGLHAEGTVAQNTYEKWRMIPLGEATHRAGGQFPVFFGDTQWAVGFSSVIGSAKMTKVDPARDAEWMQAMMALEDERGEIVPGGAQGGVVARWRREQAAQKEQPTRPGLRRTTPTASYHSRDRVRWLNQATEEDDCEAA